MVARKKYVIAHRNRNVSDLAHRGSLGRVDGRLARSLAGQRRDRWKLNPDFQELSNWGQFRDVMQRMVLPTLVLVLASIAVVERHVRASVLEVLQAPYIQAARGLGISRTRLLFRHVLPVAANPAISLFGFSLAGLLSGSLLVEAVTGWPGLGPLILEATFARDLYLVIGGVMLSAVFMIAGNLVADLLLLASDPRIRAGDFDAN
jgi:ABC-type dipeptide/oligopeptide/nickel transport system permease component